MLSITNLQVAFNEILILKGINLKVNPGEVHAIMGPNGSGKSTLANVLSGRSEYTVTGGDIQFSDQSILTWTPEQRAVAGLFLAFQYPVEIPGVNNLYFLKTAFNSVRKQRGEATLDAFDFMKCVKEKMAILNMDEKFLQRSLNEGFSGGEKKRNEILQMLMLQPKIAVLDETDSGLDIDALQIVAKGVNTLRNQNTGIVVITHYQRLLRYIEPDFVHVLAAGKIIKSGNKNLAQELEEQGYQQILADVEGK
ncbi:MAG: Fe-S cluster assembly ATPase SufC [Proteobacteria bacterium]|nr:Fe-S cluster assembly ATPase SufC [Pseudomonadota bacterium]